jgi:hypothetical protein
MIIAAIGYWGIRLPAGALPAFGAGLRAPGVRLGLTAGLFSVEGDPAQPSTRRMIQSGSRIENSSLTLPTW